MTVLEHAPCIMIACFFFFKQKTAYEMRISDWSSDVCSSDLRLGLRHRHIGLLGDRREFGQDHRGFGLHVRLEIRQPEDCQCQDTGMQAGREYVRSALHGSCCPAVTSLLPAGRRRIARSEEHTSELQSLMRNSYAVFCLKKKKHT